MFVVSIRTNCYIVAEGHTIDSDTGRTRADTLIGWLAWMGYHITSMMDNFAISTKTVECRLVIVVGNFESFKLAYDKMFSFGVSNFELEIVEKPNLWLGVLNLTNWLAGILDLWLED